MQQDEWDDTFWNSNHEHKKAKARKARHKGLKSSAIREGIEDYFEKSKLRKGISEQYQEPDFYEDLDNSDYQPRI
ncbi:hypothetical protein [Endozoicomonas sp. SCSIO W0465]|uniref:hypothetical protein n=1 Tax=Endozoicomonas sp. SCSIO W0465 TaxID=2918516 RepID=UPI0020755D8D|nr:hypothetical protein [Endozoicomonas sp. SCSIO W0465]USE35120.1 hypothetical protein MJO57_23880 [Endozoicomonas sp. SCSIO W0465]